MKKTPGTLLIEQEIERYGPMDFEKFVGLALYHPRYGYYSKNISPRGRGGDYFTSLQVSSLFPSIWADAIIEMKKTLGTDQFSLVEWGAGDGEFLLGIIHELEKRNELKRMRFWAVEAGRPAREKLVRKLSRFPKCRVVSSLDEIEAPGGLEGCFFSNEFFDALPFRRFRKIGSGWKEIMVSFSEGSLKETEIDFNDVSFLTRLGITGIEIEEGQEIEVRPLASSWIQEWGSMLARGYMATVDYGFPRPFLYSPKRSKGTWQCFTSHQAHQNPLAAIGKDDITAHIDFTQIAEAGRTVGLQPDLFCSQGIFLSFMGAERIQKYLEALDPIEQKKRIGGLQQLTHPDAMGEAFWVLIQSKEAPLPEKLKTIPNRLRRLI